jgi:hypothetical protein
VRREVRDHLLCLKEPFVAEGTAPDEAERRNMAVLGPADVLARRFRDLEHSYRPLWPIAVTLVGLLWALGSLTMAGAPAGPAVLLMLWSAVWGMAHLRSFSSLVHALRTRRPLTSGVGWTQLFPGAWPRVGAGAAFGLATALLYGPGLADLGLFGVVVAAALGVAALMVADRHPWAMGQGMSLRHPVSSGMASFGVLGTVVLVYTVLPRANPFSFAYAGNVLRIWFNGSVPVAGLIAAFYFSVRSIARGLIDRMTPPVESRAEGTLTLE